MKELIKIVTISLILLLAFSSLINAENSLRTNANTPATVILLPDNPQKYGEDSVKCVTNLSLYREFYKQWRASEFTSSTVNDAIGPWRWVFFNCPAASQYTYIDGPVMIEHFLRNEKSEDKKDKYVDTLMMIYDQRIENFGREGYILGRKGTDLLKYRPDAFKEAYPIFKRSVELQGNESESFVLAYYFRSVTQMADENLIEKITVLEVYDELNQIMDYNIEANKDDADVVASWQNIKGSIDVAFEPYATCEDLVSIYQPKFDENPEDINLLRKITKMLDNKGCTDTQLFFDASIQLNKLDPSPTSNLMIGKMLIKREKYSESLPYLEKSIEDNNEDQKADILFLISKVHQQLKNYSTSRRYALQSLELKPNNGNILISIGDMYASSSSECGDNELTKKVVYWVAVDKYVRAKQIDPEVAEIAQSRIAIYSQQFPSSETIFFYNLTEGDDYTVECWINEKTKVRAFK
ncbi:MAG TPA: tetratricopeptide repeat protein [Bacteroidales bacterium]|jgi:tetratricopeptide (TPR) repeat protein|nr:tetratricopeptide repeat protein [Bacteroidales bacterium]MBP7873171.1 tetratricopeptide repeat protein [Bacteroidales bacterium]MCZ2283167.1 tetratricopeptide repeat protein [Bacteroidales bacterium]HPX34197.1 tetratricopeptide repeat protein [Bacteroidales bacterium]HQB47965.1 tetratricopeptide repeat protein [Bacteroidales bacterium]